MTEWQPKLLTPAHPQWPSQLEDLGTATPKQLWVGGTGNLRLLALRSVAIVGARAATPYGMSAASSLASDLAASGWVVVSGAAYGIDSAAHRGAMVAGGCTVAVLAGGLQASISKARASFMAQVAQSGMLVTEHAEGETPRKQSFLERNRLIAALTRAVIVVEADIRSGSLNTARWGESIMRPVLAVPGPITSRMSAGTHKLVRDGRGILVTSVQEILEVIEPIGAAEDSAVQNYSALQKGPPGQAPELRQQIALALTKEPVSLADLADFLEETSAEVLRHLVDLRDRGQALQSRDGWCAANCG